MIIEMYRWGSTLNIFTLSLLKIFPKEVPHPVASSHPDGQPVVWLAVVECLHRHLARLQLAVAAPLGDGVCGLGDGRGVEPDLGLFRQRLQRAGVVADDHGVAFGGMLEVVKHPFFFEQALDEVEVGFAILGDVGVALAGS
jgi:hypothetical protein